MLHNDYLDAATSYSASALAGFAAWLGELNWMAVGAAVLLIARLTKDVPEAYDYLKERFRKK